MKVRQANIEDIDNIQTLYAEQFSIMSKFAPKFFCEGEQSKEFIQTIIEDDNSDILLVIDENEIVSFALLQARETAEFSFLVKSKYAYLMDIIVTQDYRSRGLGTFLMNEIKMWAKNRQLQYIELDVLSNNIDAIEFYEKHLFDDKKKTMVHWFGK